MKEEKNLLLLEVEEKIADSRGFILMSYSGMDAARTRDFRNSLAGISAEFEVVKKRIFFKALSAAGLDIPFESSKGHLGVVFAYEDMLSAAKEVLNFTKKNENALVFLGGRIDNACLSGKEVESVAKLPSLQELRGQFVGLLAAPLSGVVGVMNSVLSSVVSCVEQKAGKSS
ncbi:50S ribosomal protein L10 [Chlamydiifrater phoenicopteri]|uniref:50S ribosomal protein L10 n=1 Tax=Chlamydiifrater phoenicopteri TaxID=2681469 RepID=UPI001BD03A4F|nr:50S ribosomal protein L10 [Chlamydiifrater phoenicopteri]